MPRLPQPIRDFLAEWFPGAQHLLPPPLPPAGPLLPHLVSGSLVALLGPSGSGKTRLLKEASRRGPGDRPWVFAGAKPLHPRRSVLEQFTGEPPALTLRRLGLVGLSEVHTYAQRPAALSAGQRFRLDLALALFHAGETRAVVVADDFACLLDNTAAIAMAGLMQRIRRHYPALTLVVVLHDEQLVGPLRADAIARLAGRSLRITKVAAAAQSTPAHPESPHTGKASGVRRSSPTRPPCSSGQPVWSLPDSPSDTTSRPAGLPTERVCPADASGRNPGSE